MTRQAILIITTFLFLYNFHSANSQDADRIKEIRIPKSNSKPMTVDGIVDEDVWTHAAKIDTFENNNSKVSLKEKTTVYLYYDDEALYIAFQFEDWDIQSTYTTHDDDLWDEEVMELFIYPHADIPNPIDYFELQWNPLGTVFDGIITNKLRSNGMSRSRELDREWKAAEMRHAIHVEGTLNQSDKPDTSWSGEIKLPFLSLQQETPKPGDIWRANFYRYSRNTNEELINIAWNPTYSTYHEPNRFGRLIFE